MRRKRSVALRLLVAAAVVPGFLWYDRVLGSREVGDAQVYVQEFYDWYAGHANVVDASGPAWRKVVDMRPRELDSTLHRLLRADIEARAAGSDGIDWDPFVNRQQACPPYRAEHVQVVKAQFRVQVSADCGPGATRNQFEAVLERRSGDWVFVTVQDSKGYDAIASLKRIYPDRP